MKTIVKILIGLFLPAMTALSASAEESADSSAVTSDATLESIYQRVNRPLELPLLDDNFSSVQSSLDTISPIVLPREAFNEEGWAKPAVVSIYDMPYSVTGRSHDWRRLWINTGVLTGAFVGTLFVLEMLPEDATTWNRAELQKVPLFTRWKDHVIVKGPEWDHDKFIFNYVLHPYAGAVYFMSARSVGFNFWQSLLYSSIISDVGWEFGIEAFMERPSYQDLFITPLVGSAIGEGFYRLKRHLVDNDYHFLGSPVLGNIVAFLIDPVNEVVGLFDHNPARRVAREKKAASESSISFVPAITPQYKGFSLVATF